MADSNETEISRRDVLNSGLKTGALLVAGSAASGNATAQQGGTGFVKRFYPFADAFRVDSMNPGSLAANFRPSCNSNQGWRKYRVSYGITYFKKVNGCYEETSTTERIWVHPNGKSLTQGALYAVNNSRSCPGESAKLSFTYPNAERVTFHPVDSTDICNG